MSASSTIYLLWFLWQVSWTLAAIYSPRAESSPGLWKEALYGVLFLVGYLLMLLPGEPIFELSPGWPFVMMAAIGFGLCWWARVHLGDMWAGTVVLKPNHRLITSGPYAIFKHPIYVGLLLAMCALSLVTGTIWTTLGFPILVLALTLKAKLEDQFLQGLKT